MDPTGDSQTLRSRRDEPPCRHCASISPAFTDLGFSLVVIAAVFAGGLGLGVGMGLRPADAGSGEEIHGCINRYTGALRILSGNGQCTSVERPLSWNQQGPSGLLDIQVVRERTIINTEEEVSHGVESVFAYCPEGYRVIGGGAGGVGNFAGYDSWFVDLSGPRLADEYGSQGVDSWFASYKITESDYPVEGEYSFESVAICALTSN
ncbi:MAG TPA: hypothetical protein VKZ96_09240 [Thermomicrobiales bacterium]|nr:hypothetical protein [Thermomicrobiales bacterium]